MGTLEFVKTIVIFKISTLTFVRKQSFFPKEVNVNLRPKMLCLGFFNMKFEKKKIILEITTFKFVKMQTVLRRKKTLNLGPKMPFFNLSRFIRKKKRNWTRKR